ncbi:hypothetical protein CDAR_480471 [Caerostris darwini]|uniref:Uncharacterized protein n=1 Tax=Caerostris darwini TaxID=1538125 RepID=A0AAV4V0M8_9ARAC|nr:hypothetical protein CDAR_480461 [Caerostris darwini]GIY63687.1 hypothetical protein CDAR_480471 [Caerostris darwini]
MSSEFSRHASLVSDGARILHLRFKFMIRYPVSSDRVSYRLEFFPSRSGFFGISFLKKDIFILTSEKIPPMHSHDCMLLNAFSMLFISNIVNRSPVKNAANQAGKG